MDAHGSAVRLAVQVDVTNVDVAQGATVHWHGLRLGPEDAWVDGAEGLTQAPIPPGKTPSAVHGWHSRAGWLRAKMFGTTVAFR